MLTPRFDDLFAKLLRAFVMYDEHRRNPVSVTELALARRHLDFLRAEIALERERILATQERSRAQGSSADESELQARSNLFTLANTSG